MASTATINNAAAKYVGEETIIYTAKLSERWKTWRFWTCSAKCAHLFPILSPL